MDAEPRCPRPVDGKILNFRLNFTTVALMSLDDESDLALPMQTTTTLYHSCLTDCTKRHAHFGSLHH